MMEEPQKSDETNTTEATGGEASTDEKISQSVEPNVEESSSQSVNEENQSSGDSAEPPANSDNECKNEETEEPDDNIEVDSAAIEKLTLATLEMFLPNLQKAKGSLNELLHNQEVLIETVQQENSKFSDSTALKQMLELMQEAKRYHTKLVNLKREMNALTEKSAKLKRRAVKIQQQKQKEELTRADQIDRERERERMLTAKVAKPTKDQSQ
ncbi:biogenesis of lysosome-related organelles complex 1 subunit 6 [Mactra antiquata]